MNLQEFVIEFKDLHSDGQNQEEKFINAFCEYLEANELFTDFKLSYRSQLGIQANAYAYDRDHNKLIFIVADYENFHYGTSVSKTIIQKLYKRALKYIKKARTDLVNVIEDIAGDYPLAQLIYELDYEQTEIEVLILSNRIYKSNASVEIEVVEGKEIVYQIWDIERLFQLVNESQGVEAIEIDLTKLSQKSFSMLRVDENSNDFDCFVGYISGDTLATLYEQWGQRLIERNVRSFLQSRGKVNKGIKNTLRSEKEMFVAYNNGISTVAEEVEAEVSADGLLYKINKIKGLQVVNGGQTTASLYYTKKEDKVDLSNVYIQIKLTVIKSREKMNMMTSKISEYANTQNKISESDLKANHEALINLENLSRTTWVPSASNLKSNNRWFFERARGQYLVDLSRETTPARKNEFKKVNPKSQLLSKTDVAKFYMSWIQYPHKVSNGGESNFKAFMELIDQSVADINTAFYKQLIAMAILFKTCDDLVKEAKYPGYKINIVTYTLAALSYGKGNQIDLMEIWSQQSVPEKWIFELARLLPITWEHINNPPVSGSNITSWCKKEECWLNYQEKLKKHNKQS
ncbi:AIPR family protein [Peribacillus sp. NPDC056705]|uniref:AIPR family protein n=1 Tax=Peribacillus sp. NPDC056705 TaxID=3345918 RepID=UPI0037496CA9